MNAIDSIDSIDSTPLHEAVTNQQVEAAAALLELGADRAKALTEDLDAYKAGMTPADVVGLKGNADLSALFEG